MTPGPAKASALALLLAALTSVAPGMPVQGQSAAASQDDSTRIRLVGFRTLPSAPEFGTPFDLELRLRIAPASMVFLPDTLNAADASVSAGPGEWDASDGPADSVDVVATYPVMSFLSGEVELPELEVWVGSLGDGDDEAVRSATDLNRLPTAAAEALRPVVVSTGRIRVETLREMAGAADSLLPRPPADVLGAGWSPWLILVVALTGLIVAVVAWTAYTSWQGSRVRVATRGRLGSARGAALSELDRILSSEWHRQGRLVEFYDASTGVLRRFSEHEEPDWGTALTSSELVQRIGAVRGPETVEDLASAVAAAEWVKFGGYRPDAEDAEAHWTVIRNWIESMPEHSEGR